MSNDIEKLITRLRELHISYAQGYGLTKSETLTTEIILEHKLLPKLRDLTNPTGRNINQAFQDVIKEIEGMYARREFTFTEYVLFSNYVNNLYANCHNMLEWG